MTSPSDLQALIDIGIRLGKAEAALAQSQHNAKLVAATTALRSWLKTTYISDREKLRAQNSIEELEQALGIEAPLPEEDMLYEKPPARGTITAAPDEDNPF